MNDKYNTYNKDKYDKAIRNINVNNLEYVMFSGLGGSEDNFIEQILHPMFKKPETEEITHPRSENDVIKDCKHLRKVMQQWCKKHGIDTSELDKQEFELNAYDPNNLIHQYTKLIHNYRDSQVVQGIMTRDVRSNMQESIDQRYSDALETGEELTTNNPAQSDSQARLQKIVNENKKFSALLHKEYDASGSEIFFNDSGNGKFARPALQQTGNCWLLAGINALISTEFGKEFLERNIIKDEEKHIYAIHLQEAENKNLPKPKGEGIYVLTEKEVLDSQSSVDGLTSGEGDIAAYALAIERYLQESQGGTLEEGKEHFIDGNNNFKLFEIVTGLEPSGYKKPDIGIHGEVAHYYGDGEHMLLCFGDVFEISQNKNGAVTLGAKKHAFSVVGNDGENLLIQESTLSGMYKDRFKLIEDSFPPTYKVSKEVFERYFTDCVILRWK